MKKMFSLALGTGSAILLCAACSAVFAETNDVVYVGIDAKGVRHESKESAGDGPWMRDLAHAVMPSVSSYALSRGFQGVGIFRLRIDTTTGATRDITVLRSTGHVMLDRNALLALKLWRWKPGTWMQVDIPAAFQLGGGVLFFPRYTVLPGELRIKR